MVSCLFQSALRCSSKSIGLFQTLTVSWTYRKIQCFGQWFQCRCRISSENQPNRSEPTGDSLPNHKLMQNLLQWTKWNIRCRYVWLTEFCRPVFCWTLGEITKRTSTNLAVTYGFRMHCGAQTQVSNQVMIESLNTVSIVSWRNLQNRISCIRNIRIEMELMK